MGVLSRTKKQEKRASTKPNAVLKVVHPRGYTLVLCEPITAGELMKRYPRHCVTRPDVFEFPWIVVRPESVLEPGKVFYLVPFRTLDKLCKSKRQQLESLHRNRQDNQHGLGQPYHHHHHHHNNNNSIVGYKEHDNTDEKDPNHHTLYKESFYKSWNEMRRTVLSQSDHEDHLLDWGLDHSPLEGGRPHVTSPECEELLSLKSCLRKEDSVRKKLNLSVGFTSPVATLCSRSGSPSVQKAASSASPVAMPHRRRGSPRVPSA